MLSRYCGDRDLKDILEAGAHWRQNGLLTDGSIFTEKSLWRWDNLTPLDKYFINQPDEGKGSFFEKLSTQLLPTAPEVKQLAAEILWVMMLCPSNIGKDKKREGIRKIWSWSGEPLPESPWLKDAALAGVGSTGAGYNTNRWLEVVFTIQVVMAFKQLAPAEREALLKDGWKFAEWLEQIPGCNSRQFRHMMLFLLFPDDFERILGGADRRKIVCAFGGKSDAQANKLTALEIDKELATIRKQQEETHGTKELDFYMPLLRNLWGAVGATSTPPDLDKKDPRIGEAINLIYYGPPGTGKTYQLGKLIERYSSKKQTIGREAWLIQQLLDVRWFDAVFAALYDLGGKAKVADIAEHDFISLKARAMGRRQNIAQTIWATLQAHTIEASQTVQYKNRSAPSVFDKSKGSAWSLSGEWEEECAEQVILAKSLKKGPLEESSQRRYEFVTFHQAYSYEDFIEGIRPIQDEKTGELAYMVVPGVFQRTAQKAKADPSQRYALFIDEINRGNISKIFGELITLIEQDKRAEYAENGEKKSGMEVTLPYSGNLFGVPQNLDVYGTMNTADRSIALLDTALRRRFKFHELMPDAGLISGSRGDGYIEDGEGGVINLRALLEAMNRRIGFLLNRDMTLGHAYFMNVKDFSGLKDVLLNQVLPLLQEYFYEDWHRIQLVLRDVGPAGEKLEPQIVCHNSLNGQAVLGFDNDDYENLIEYQVAVCDDITPDSVRKVYEGAV